MCSSMMGVAEGWCFLDDVFIWIMCVWAVCFWIMFVNGDVLLFEMLSDYVCLD